MKGMYTLQPQTTKVALQHLSKKTLYELIRNLGKSFSNRLDTPEHNVASIMRYYAVGAFNHVEIIEETIKKRFKKADLKKFSEMKPIKNISDPHPVVRLKSGFYFKWKSKKTWELYSINGNSMNLFVIGKARNIERKLVGKYPDYLYDNFILLFPETIQ